MQQTRNSQHRVVIYSFHDKWRAPLEGGYVSVFFRKRAPVITPEIVLFYIGTPSKTVIGWSRVIQTDRVGPDEAVKLSGDGAISKQDLLAYFGSDDFVYAISISQPELFKNPVSLETMREEMGFFPPQSFSHISGDAAEKIMGLGS